MPNETIGLGAVVELNDGGGSSFVVIPQVESIEPPAESVGVVESKRLDLVDGVLVHIPGLKNGETFSLRIQMANGTYERLEIPRKARTEKQWRFTIPNLTQFTVPGFITRNAKNTVEADGLVTFTCEVQVSGAEV